VPTDKETKERPEQKKKFQQDVLDKLEAAKKRSPKEREEQKRKNRERAAEHAPEIDVLRELHKDIKAKLEVLTQMGKELIEERSERILTNCRTSATKTPASRSD